MTEPRPEKWPVLTASPKGNGVGLGIVTPAERPPIIFHVLPKFWRPEAEARKLLLPDAPADDSPTVLTLYEQDQIRVPIDIAGRILDAPAIQVSTDRSTDPETESESRESGSTDLLFEQKGLSDGTGFSPIPAESDSVRFTQLWMLISANLGTDALRELADPVFLGQIAPHVPPLEPLFHRAFVTELAESLRTRRKNFIPFTEESIFIRGRMELRSLIDRQARRRLPVECTFEDLSHDTTLWQVVRAAARQVAATGNRDNAARAAQLDSRLADVSIVPAAAAIGLLATTRRSQDARQRLRLLQLAQSVLLCSYPAGGLDTADQAPTVTIKVATSILWENLLEAALEREGCGERVDPAGKRLFVHTGHKKKPDIMREIDERTVIVDAKYKEQGAGPATLTSLSMSDQYQCFAYATLHQARTAFVTVRRTGSANEFTPDETNIPDRTDRVDNSSGRPVAVIPIEFPQPGKTEIADISRLTDWLQK